MCVDMSVTVRAALSVPSSNSRKISQIFFLKKAMARFSVICSIVITSLYCYNFPMKGGDTVDKDKIAHDLAVAAIQYYVELPPDGSQPDEKSLAESMVNEYKSLYPLMLRYLG